VGSNSEVFGLPKSSVAAAFCRATSQPALPAWPLLELTRFPESFRSAQVDSLSVCYLPLCPWQSLAGL
jgi:hypothetical protein